MGSPFRPYSGEPLVLASGYQAKLAGSILIQNQRSIVGSIVYHPTTRVLTVLELLQTHGRMTGAELSERLEVDIRTVRRYITMLQDLGIPVEAERGRYGAYTVRPSHKLPPLMFTAEEALALTLGLVMVQQQELTTETPAAESARTKLVSHRSLSSAQCSAALPAGSRAGGGDLRRALCPPG
jgi:predicted DNA-binding transcriptional regulator YafY